MGGLNSGTWPRPKTRATVESCPVILSVYKLAHRGTFQSGASGYLTWKDTRFGEAIVSMGYAMIRSESGLVLYTTYELDSEKIEYGIRLQTTRPNYGGTRWWFTCPLKGCDRRVAKLYLASRYFGCRQCYDLTYRTCQRSKRTRDFEKNLLSELRKRRQ